MERNRNAGSVSEALWLAKRDIRRAWLSYPMSGLYMLFFGFLVLPSVGDPLDGSPFVPFFADFLLVIMGCLLVVNAISMDYLRVFTSDVFSNRTAFLRSLPLSTGTLVVSRMISMLCAVPFTVPGFFIPLFLFTDLRELGFSFVWFVGIWLGWGLFYAGVTLLCELGLSGKAYCWISVAIIVAFVVLVVGVEAAFGFSLVRGSASLASGYGPIPALVSILIGGLGFVLLARLTVKRVDGREVGS